MTTEEKAKAYDEALERAKAYHRNELAGTRKEMMEYIFPELRESEDERIRRKMIEHFKSKTKETWCNMPVKDILEYLEKQKEQKPAEKQDYSGLNDLERAIHRGFLCAGVENVPVGIIKDTAAECMAFLALIEPKPAEWSEEDEQRIAEIEFAVMQMNTQRNDTKNKCLDWLKSLRPQYHGDVTMTEAYKMGLETGKASSWKPSEHQMKILKAVKEYVGRGSGYWGEALGSLIEDLEKL